MKNTLLTIASLLLLSSCGSKNGYDASGNFEADEVIASAQQNGQLLSFDVEEGMQILAGAQVGQIDVAIPVLEKQEVEASVAALKEKTSRPDVQTEFVKRQLIVQQAQLAQQYREQARTQNLVNAGAATQKQLDDINALIDQLQKQISATKQQIKLNIYNTSTQNRNIMSQEAPLQKSAQQFQEQINEGKVINPVTGTVLTKYALKGEIETIGKPLYKIANIDTLTLRAYITGTQLPQIKLNQQVKVRIDEGKKSYRTYTGTVSWISDISEFTPKTIETKDERTDLVYAIKVRVKNDGYLKIGMYAEVLWSDHR